MLIKYAHSEMIVPESKDNAFASVADSEIEERFKKFAKELKTIAPKAKDFLYFTAIMMHSAEAALYDRKGELKKDASGSPLTAEWVNVTDPRGNQSIKWVCSDTNIFPYKNTNGDIFPEYELKTAHEKWRGRPLCIDHKSNSVDHIRGLIVDTFYDSKRKRVIALCALDKKNYPDLAHKVASGYSANVSMGTAVGRAICTETGCHRVARVESDFCEHMRAKSGYGEVNLDLAPIELSIVVNGADPDAKIKHIIAKDLSKAADDISAYMESKISTGNVSKNELTDLQKELAAIAERVNKLIDSAGDANEISESAPYGVTGSTPDMPEAEKSNVNQSMQLPEGIPSIHLAIEDLNDKIVKLREDYEKLASLNKEENTMTTEKQEKKAYFQGGGGVNEPTPGTPKYPVEDYVSVRDTQDKQMVGQAPFPGVGPVDGMHPGPQSAGISEEARKRELQRLAALEERRLTREAALEKIKDEIGDKKEAYYHGTTEPTAPGKVQYPPDPMQEKVRNTQDKQMVGQSPFPGVGSVDGLHPSPASADTKDEAKRKQMLSRASLRAKFTKAATPEGDLDRGNSMWQVYAGQNLILTATVDEISRGNAEVVYDGIATEAYGKKLMETIRVEGFAKAKALFKGGQAMGAPEPAKETPGSPPDVAGPAPMPTGDMDMPHDPGVGGGPDENMVELAAKVREAAEDAAKYASDLEEAAKAAEGESADLEGVAPAEEAAFADDGVETTTASLQSMRKTLNGLLRESMSETVAALNAHAHELSIADDVYSNKASNLTEGQREYLDTLARDAVAHTKRTVADAQRLMAAFVKYAHGTKSLIKRAEAEATLIKQAQMAPSQTMDVKPGEANPQPVVAPKPDTSHDPLADLEGKPLEGTGDSTQMADDGAGDTNNVDGGYHYGPSGEIVFDEPMHVTPEKPGVGRPEEGKDLPVAPIIETLKEKGAADANDVTGPGGGPMVEISPDTQIKDLPEGAKLASEFDLTTAEGRAQARTKLAQTGIQFSNMLDRAHPSGSAEVANMDTKPSGDLGRVEDLEDAHDAHMNLANMPPKVRKQAETIAKLVAQGEVSPDEVDELAKLGVDSDAIKYYKQYWGEAKDKESKDFAASLVKEHAAKKKAEELETVKVRMKRAYDLAYEMRDRGIIETSQIEGQVNEILAWNDASFDSCKKIIAQHEIKKQAMPSVGLLHSADVILPSAESANEGNVDVRNVFIDYFGSRRF